MAEQKNFSDELVQKAANCKTPEQVIELAKTENITMTKEEAEAFLEQMHDIELDSNILKAVAGGRFCDGRIVDLPIFFPPHH